MKCPECGKEMRDRFHYDSYDSCTDATYTVDCHYHVCDCGYTDVSDDVAWGGLMLKSKEAKWGEWILSNVRSFDDIGKLFIGRTEVVSMIRNYQGEKVHRLTKEHQERRIDYWCFHFRLFGKRYYLKRSVEKYLKSGNGLWKLSNGLEE